MNMNGIMFDIRSNVETFFTSDSMFKYLYENKNGSEIPEDVLQSYVIERNYINQTPLMYSVILLNENYVKALIKYDIGLLDNFNRSALMYAEDLQKNKTNLSEEQTKALNNIIHMLEEYECYEY